MINKALSFLVLFLINHQQVFAADAMLQLPGNELTLVWAFPFIGMLASLALFPLFAPRIWHHHYGKIALILSLFTVIPCLYFYGLDITIHEILHTYLLEYVPFILVAMTLFTISGGIKVELARSGDPKFNTLFLALATFVASWIGTTGAAMLFIRPLIAMNKWRKHQVHLIIFFILLVCNMGGSLTALGDPPLFLGFLKGVPFFWPFTHLMLPFLIVVFPLLIVFYGLDYFYFRKENLQQKPDHNNLKNSLEGKINMLLLGLVMISVIISGSWKSGFYFNVWGVEVALENIVRDITFIFLTIISMKITPLEIRKYNLFSWAPILEVAKLFAGIFITAMPVITILGAGQQGALGAIVSLVNTDNGYQNDMYFWLTGLLSAFLDNAPTYLVFFHMAGGDAHLLSTTLSDTLIAISSGAVFMGAITYIGNAPNFLVKSIAEMNQIAMPHFFGYMLRVCVLLLPLFMILSYFIF